MRAYVTGGAGFVGSWLVSHLEAEGDEVVAVDSETDVTDSGIVARSMSAASPDVVYHLAGVAHVGRSWQEPQRTFAVNALGTLNVLESASLLTPAPRVLSVSSAEVYGAVGGEPVDEGAELRPVNPYAASKAAAEFVALQHFLGRGLQVVRVRPFNHVGPGQSPDFVVSGLARRIAEAERAGGGVVAVGNLEATRDFTDVRDVVRAYRLLAASGRAGGVYNLASGRGVRIRDLAESLCERAQVPVQLTVDAELMRPVDVPVMVGDATKLTAETGWRPLVPLEQTLTDVLEHWRKRP